jgi:uncharacterized protein YggE
MKTISRMMKIVAAGLLLAAANPSALRAQAAAPDLPAEKPEGPSIAGVGTARVKLAPTVLRMHLILLGRGKTAEDALAALKTRRELAVSQLEKLKVAKDSISFSNLAASSGANQQQRRMEMMIAQRMGRKKNVKPVQPPVTVTTLLTAEWNLAGDAPEKLLITADTLRRQIQAADLSGAKEMGKLSGEEQELAEEMADQIQQMDPSEDESTQPGQPQLIFVAKLPAKDRQAAAVEAFGKARKQALELAEAAGVTLGRLTGLSGRANGHAEFEQYGGYSYNNSYMRVYQRAMQSAAESEDRQDESSAPTADGIEFTFYVTATFAIGAPAPK